MITIQEPMTAFTDLVITAVSLYAFFRLRRKWPDPTPHERIYLWFFLLMGISTLFGACLSHAFAYAFPSGQYNLLPNWITNVLSVACYPLALIGRADQVRTLPAKKLLTAAVLVETAVILVLMLWKMSFLYDEIHIAACVYLFALPLQIRLWKDGCRAEIRAAWAAGVLMTLIPVVLVTKMHLGAWMNDFDISHVLIAVAMYLYFRAGLHWRHARPALP